MKIIASAKHIGKDLSMFWRLPCVAINLMHPEAKLNHPFYEGLVRKHYREAQSLHPKFLVIRRFVHGVALCKLPPSVDEYLANIEAAGRRNFKKAKRAGYEFSRINFNDHLESVAEIRRSSTVRQGSELPAHFFQGCVERVNDPKSQNPHHDYAYFGITREGKLFAYAGVFIAGEICLLEQVYGHTQYQSDGIVPMLFVSIVDHLVKNHPRVRYFAYGSFFGARDSMRRFKSKFGFVPHRVRWKLTA